jgi:hypothetical protein
MARVKYTAGLRPKGHPVKAVATAGGLLVASDGAIVAGLSELIEQFKKLSISVCHNNNFDYTV